MPRPENQSTHPTLQEILRVAFELFGRHGYEGVSISQIAAAARTTTGALYWHFDDKGDLYRRCLDELRDRFRTHLLAPLSDASQGPSEALGRYFSGLVQMVGSPENAQIVAGYVFQIGDPEWPIAQGFGQALETEVLGLLEANFEQGQACGEYRFEYEPARYARIVLATMLGCTLQARRGEGEAVQRMVRLLSDEILSRVLGGAEPRE